MHRDDVDDLSGVADDADAAVDELLLDRVVQDDLRGPRLREGERHRVDAVVAGRVPDVPEMALQGDTSGWQIGWVENDYRCSNILLGQ